MTKRKQAQKIRKTASRIIGWGKYCIFRVKQSTRLGADIRRINLCGGQIHIPGYLNIDIGHSADLPIDLSKRNLPFDDESIEAVVCMSAINYFTYTRAAEIIREVHRVLQRGGIARFGVQDLETIAARYLNKDREFFFQKLPDGRDRFEGPTIGDKFAAWFYGYESGGSTCKYFFDFDSLAFLFHEAGFVIVEKSAFQSSRISGVTQIDNRSEQMFFLEAVK
jgi:predicted SAM-dependent methyltransferase